eukprot:CAMPEP_0184738518 /NCGR_PEP_ID=MMETSP0315-20130426/1150_1 /TAXON_ID=101924 /ORGANISM="Rhodosorus marinus, Strain UTEX LB 2760" /LENGTH=75 /DNA_ID=CAMNT_0027206257 /DNA_START=58 /DNA_END=282 /DNA_ORIENTATION=-
MRNNVPKVRRISAFTMTPEASSPTVEQGFCKKDVNETFIQRLNSVLDVPPSIFPRSSSDNPGIDAAKSNASLYPH